MSTEDEWFLIGALDKLGGVIKRRRKIDTLLMAYNQCRRSLAANERL